MTGTLDVTAFDELRAVVAPGGGVVARFPGLLAVAEGPDDAVRALVDLCRECAGDEPGRTLARRLGAWLGGEGGDDADGLRFGTVARSERGLGVFLRGPVDLLVPDRGTVITGADAATWTDRLIAAPDAPLTLVLQGTATPAELVASVYDLWEGVVPGGGVVAVAAGWFPVAVPADEPAAPAESAAGRARHRRPDTGELPVMRAPGGSVATPVVGGPVAVPAAGGSAPNDQRADGSGADGSGADGSGADGSGADGSGADGSRADGSGADDVVADRSAADGPAADGSAADGPAADGPAADGPAADDVGDEPTRPGAERAGVWGVLVFDDGTTHVLDADCLLGREPETDGRVQAGALHAVTLDDPSGAMSRVHAEIRLEDGHAVLVDAVSSNGTYVAEPDADSWTPLPVGRPVRLAPGTRVQIGQRTLTFETSEGA